LPLESIEARLEKQLTMRDECLKWHLTRVDARLLQVRLNGGPFPNDRPGRGRKAQKNYNQDEEGMRHAILLLLRGWIFTREGSLRIRYSVSDPLEAQPLVRQHPRYTLSLDDATAESPATCIAERYASPGKKT
jgi:hypothetical protein